MKVKRKYESVEVIDDFLEFIDKFNTIPEIHVGTDSQLRSYNEKRVFKFITCVLLYHNSVDPEMRIAKIWIKKGFEEADHFAYRDRSSLGGNIPQRMIAEAAQTLEVAEELVESGIIDRESITIGLDVNSDEEYRSHDALSSCAGMFTGMGYERVECKPDTLIT